MPICVSQVATTNIINTDDTRSIPLTNSTIPCLIDAKDFFKVSDSKWFLNKEGYVANTIDGSLLHRYITNPNPEEVVHHINGIKTDNRQRNLQKMSVAEHSRLHKLKKNGIFEDYHGFTVYKNNKKPFRVRIRYNGYHNSIGSFEDPITAQTVYDLVLNEIHGDKL